MLGSATEEWDRVISVLLKDTSVGVYTVCTNADTYAIEIILNNVEIFI